MSQDEYPKSFWYYDAILPATMQALSDQKKKQMRFTSKFLHEQKGGIGLKAKFRSMTSQKGEGKSIAKHVSIILNQLHQVDHSTS